MEIIGYLLLAYLYTSGMEWAVHKYLMHSSTPGFESVYKDHNVHHSVYYLTRFLRDKDIESRFSNLFVCFKYNLIVGFPGLVLGYLINPLLGLFILLTVPLHFVLFNYIHSSLHLGHRIWFAPSFLENCLLKNHILHHRHPNKFFCVAFPGFDYVVGTVCTLSMEDEYEISKVQMAAKVRREADKANMKKWNHCDK